jgi:hypothetical protein
MDGELRRLDNNALTFLSVRMRGGGTWCNTPSVTIAAIVHLQYFYSGCYNKNLVEVRFKFEFNSCWLFLFKSYLLLVMNLQIF